jgi:hydroxymethylglutaryl-CoA synthase
MEGKILDFGIAIHGTYMADTYDFYKPNLSSEYPEVDGPGSVVTYIQAFDAAYNAYKTKAAKAAKKANGHVNGTNGYINGDTPALFSLDDVDYALFHSPYGKQTIKGHARMLYNDFIAAPKAPQFANIPEPEAFLSATHVASLTDKNLEKTFVAAGKKSFAQKVDPTMACSRRLGNMYTASLYGCLASLLSTVPSAELQGKRASLYAFGGGCAGSFWTLRIKGDTSEIAEKMDLLNRLAKMKVVPCQEFVDALEVFFVSVFLRNVPVLTIIF